MIRLPELKFLVIVLLVLATSMFMPQGTASAYYGGLPGVGFYGLGGPYGSLYGGFYPGNGFAPLARTSAVLLTPTVGGGGGTILPTTTIAPTVSIAVPIFPDPTGIYAGTWTSIITSNTNAMAMTLTYDILSISLTGTAGLLLNKLIPIAINVSGFNNAPTFTLTGTYFDINTFITYTMDLNCSFSPATLTLPAIIRGAYYIHDPLFLKVDTGTFAVGRL